MPKNLSAGVQTASFKQAAPRPGSQFNYHTTFLVVHMLGSRYDRAFDNYARRSYSRVGGHRQVYEVDRVQAN
jgi:hypothetical protein